MKKLIFLSLVGVCLLAKWGFTQSLASRQIVTNTVVVTNTVYTTNTTLVYTNGAADTQTFLWIYNAYSTNPTDIYCFTTRQPVVGPTNGGWLIGFR